MRRIRFRKCPASDPWIGAKLGDQIIVPGQAPSERRQERLQRKVVQNEKLAVLSVLGIVLEHLVQLMHFVALPIQWGEFRPDLTYSASIGDVRCYPARGAAARMFAHQYHGLHP